MTIRLSNLTIIILFLAFWLLADTRKRPAATTATPARVRRNAKRTSTSDKSWIDEWLEERRKQREPIPGTARTIDPDDIRRRQDEEIREAMSS